MVVQRSVTHSTRPAARVPAARVEVQSSERAVPLTFLALAVGVATGVVLAGGIVPVVIHTILGMVLRTVSGT